MQFLSFFPQEEFGLEKMKSKDLVCTVCNSKRVQLTSRVKTAQIPNRLNIEWGIESIGGRSMVELLSFDYVEHYICRECYVGSWIPKVPGDAGFYESLNSLYVDKRWDKQVVCHALIKSSSILDVGSGPNPIFGSIKDRDPTNDAAIDENPFALEKMKSSGITGFDSPAEMLKTSPRFTSICALHFLEHIRNPKDYFRSLVENLLPGGDLWISVPNRDRYISNSVFDSLDVPPHHLTTWNIEALINFGKQLELVTSQIWVSKPNSQNLIKRIWRKKLKNQYFELSNIQEYLSSGRPVTGYQILIRFIKSES